MLFYHATLFVGIYSVHFYANGMVWPAGISLSLWPGNMIICVGHFNTLRQLVRRCGELGCDETLSLNTFHSLITTPI